MHMSLSAGPIRLEIGRRRPLTVLLVRHGQSQTNIDKSLHRSLVDPDVELTDLGQSQAKEAGIFLDGWLAHEKKRAFRVYRSDYRRAVQTSDIIVEQLRSHKRFDTRIDDRIRELEFGYSDLVDNKELAEAFPPYYAYTELWSSDAKYYRRRLGGESPADVGDRLRHFIGAMYRDQDRYGIDTFVVINHGLTSRVLAKLLLKQDRVWYAEQKNPGNCAIRLIEGKADRGYIFGGPE